MRWIEHDFKKISSSKIIYYFDAQIAQVAQALSSLSILSNPRLIFSLRQCSSLKLVWFFDHNFGPKLQLRCISEVLGTRIVTLFSPLEVFVSRLRFFTFHHAKKFQNKHSSSILRRWSYLCICFASHAIMPVLLLPRCNVQGDKTISKMRELLSS